MSLWDLPWYIWVWGILSCLVLLLTAVALVVLIIYLRRNHREVISDLRYEIRQLEAEVRLHKMRGDKYKTQLELERAGNEFGRVQP